MSDSNSIQLMQLGTLCEELKCSLCQKLLNVFPVYCGQKIGNVCGRCTKDIELDITNGYVQRAEAYEAIAKYVEFPCIFKDSGCKASLKWDRINEHESICQFRETTVDCFFKPCTWKGGNIAFSSHLLDYHKDYYQPHPISFSIPTSDNIYKTIFITSLAEHLFVVMIVFVQNTLCCTVKYVFKRSQFERYFYRFQLELGKNSNERTLILRKDYTEELLFFFPKGTGIELDMKSAIGILGELCDVICGKISIIKKSKKEINAISQQYNIVLPIAKAAPNQRDGSLSNLSYESKTPIHHMSNTSISNKSEVQEKCCVCKFYITDSVFECPNNHTICKSCKDKTHDCPSCNLINSSISNHSTEKLSDQIHCKFANNGCKAILNQKAIEQHTSKCMYNNLTLKCPFRLIPGMCDNKNNVSNIYDHIRNNHFLNYFEEGNIFTLPLGLKQRLYYVTFYKNEIFILYCLCRGPLSPLKFDCFCIGTLSAETKHTFELEFINSSHKGLKLIIGQMCRQPDQIQSINSVKAVTVTIPMDLLKSFIADQSKPVLHLKCGINEIFG